MELSYTPDKRDVKTIIEMIDKQYIAVGEHLQQILTEKAKTNNEKFNPRDYMLSQRKYCWETWRASNLIQSMLIQAMPIPELMFYRHDDKSQFRKTLDGQQRLTSIYLFVNNVIKLDMSKTIFPTFEIEGEIFTIKDLQGKTFSELPELWQDIILGFTIRYTCINNCDEETAEKIFTQVNGGSKVLRAAEIRRAGMGGKLRKSFNIALSHDWVLHAITTSSIVGNAGIEIMGHVVTLLDNNCEALELSKSTIDNILYGYRDSGLPETMQEKINSVSEYLNNTTSIWIEEKKQADSQKEKGKKVSNYNTYRFSFLNKTNTVTLIIAALKAQELNIKEKSFAKWAYTFFSNQSKEYKEHCGSGSSKAIDIENVQGRLDTVTDSLTTLSGINNKQSEGEAISA